MEPIKDNLNQSDINHLKLKLTLAREKLQQAWNKQGETDEIVLAAGAEFDALLNQYKHLKQG